MTGIDELGRMVDNTIREVVWWWEQRELGIPADTIDEELIVPLQPADGGVTVALLDMLIERAAMFGVILKAVKAPAGWVVSWVGEEAMVPRYRDLPLIKTIGDIDGVPVVVPVFGRGSVMREDSLNENVGYWTMRVDEWSRRADCPPAVSAFVHRNVSQARQLSPGIVERGFVGWVLRWPEVEIVIDNVWHAGQEADRDTLFKMGSMLAWDAGAMISVAHNPLPDTFNTPVAEVIRILRQHQVPATPAADFNRFFGVLMPAGL